MDWMTVLPLIALCMDFVWGDPRSLPHPVQGIGWVLHRLENYIRLHGRVSKTSGVCAVCAVLLLVGGLVHVGVHLPLLGGAVALYCAWAGLAAGSLLFECRKAANAIARSVDEGRAAVAMLVSRDTTASERPELYRALAETVAENVNDGFVAPFFWLCLGGPVGLWLFKTVSTFDSMWGYRTEKWAKLGWAGARLDDFLGWIPARITAMLFALTAPLAGIPKQQWHWGCVRRDAKKMDSPNAGWPMSMAAWLHGRRMGGATVYFGKVKEKPILGPFVNSHKGEWDFVGIEQLLRHVRITAMLGGVLLWLFFFIVL